VSIVLAENILEIAPLLRYIQQAGPYWVKSFYCQQGWPDGGGSPCAVQREYHNHHEVVENEHFLTCMQQTSCGIHQLAANRLEVNFTRPEEFLPERWFDDAPAEFANDRREIYQPFSFGPRNCIGKP
jgi:hypothetical protein